MCSFLELPVPETGQELNKIVAKINYFTSHIPDFLYTQPFYPFQNYKRNIKKDIKPLFKALLESTSKAILLVPIQSGVKRLIVTVVTNGKSISATMSVQYESIHYSIALYGRVLKSAEVNYAYETKLLLAVRDTINDNLPITSIYPITAISNVRHLVRNVHLPKITFNTH